MRLLVMIRLTIGGFRLRKVAFIASIVGAAALACSAAMPAAQAGTSDSESAAAHPSMTFYFKNQRVNQHSRPTVIYSTGHLPAHSVIYLQRQFGSAHVWENVEHLKLRSGTVTAPGVEMGKYDYRVRVTARGTVVVTSRTRALYSYGRVALNAFCNESEVGYCGSPATVQIGQVVFTYVLANYVPNSYPTYSDVLEFNATTCDGITVQYATTDTTSGDYAYFEVVQARSDPQYGQTPVATVGTFYAALDGGPFYLEDSETTGSAVYSNGYATCYTQSGLP
jgi:hypothetical protein